MLSFDRKILSCSFDEREVTEHPDEDKKEGRGGYFPGNNELLDIP